ncbi:MAG: PAS domain S-box protein [Armatimonadetes bacterium]|nr:PAS domain S-box protein [Armatimonadota bacterium]MDE2207562.1 PAS domain S-box protein [Armatimonadota bacterium]
MIPYRAGRSAALQLLLASAAAAVFSLATWSSIRHADRLRDEMRATSSARDALQQVTSAVDDAEKGERGYLLTGRPIFLNAYYDSVSQVERQLQRVRLLVRGDRSFARLTAAISGLAADRLRELHQTIQISRSGDRAAAAAVVNGGADNGTMDALRSQVTAARDYLQNSISDQSTAAGLQIRVAGAIALAVTLLTVLMFTAASIRLMGSRRREVRAIANLAALELRAEAMLRSIGDAVIAADASGRVTLMNAAAERLTGWSMEEAAGRSITDVFVATDDQNNLPAESAFDRIQRAGTVIGVCNHTVLHTRTGNRIPIDNSGAPIRDEDGKPSGVILCFRDCSERGLAELALRRSEERYRAMFERNPTPMWAYDRETMAFLEVNDAAIRQYGYSRDEFLAMHVNNLWPSEVAEQFARMAREEPAGFRASEFCRHRRKNGEVFHVEIWSDKMVHAGRQAVLVLAIDRSETARAQAAMEELNRTLEQRVASRTRELEAANAELSVFIDATAHDLRAPVRWVRGYAHALCADFGDVLPDEVISIVKRIDRAGGLLGELVDGLYRLSFAARAPIQPRVVDVSGIARSLLSQLQLAEPERRVEFHVQPNIEAYADEEMLTVALTNLIGNAWKFSRDSNPAIIEVQSLQTRDDMDVIVVRDNGIGFESAKASEAFEPFKLVHHGGFDGSGLGLATVKRIVERHNGAVDVVASPGSGAVFQITLPKSPVVPAELQVA